MGAAQMLLFLVCDAPEGPRNRGRYRPDLINYGLVEGFEAGKISVGLNVEGDCVEEEEKLDAVQSVKECGVWWLLA